MRILFLTTTLPRFSDDGQSPFVLEQALFWKKARPQDQVFILAPSDELAKDSEEIDGVIIKRFNYFFNKKWQKLVYPAILPNLKSNPWLIIQLPFLLLFELINLTTFQLSNSPTMIYAHWVVPNGLVAYLGCKVARLQSCKVEYVVHNHSSDLRQLIKIPFLGKWLAKKIIRNSHKFFCVNSKLRDEALNLFSPSEQKSLASKIIVLPMGVNIENPKSEYRNSKQPQSSKFKTINFTTFQPYNLPTYKYDLSFIGRLTEKKGLLYFLEAVAKINKPLRIAIAGKGEQEKEIREKILEIRNKRSEIKDEKSKQIEMLGQVVGEEKIKLFQKTKFFVFPSLSSGEDLEGLPVAMLEVLAAGKTILASQGTNIETLPEYPQIKESVLIIPNPIDTSQFVKILFSALSLKSREIAEHSANTQAALKKYLWPELIKKYIEEIYD